MKKLSSSAVQVAHEHAIAEAGAEQPASRRDKERRPRQEAQPHAVDDGAGRLLDHPAPQEAEGAVYFVEGDTRSVGLLSLEKSLWVILGHLHLESFLRFSGNEAGLVS